MFTATGRYADTAKQLKLSQDALKAITTAALTAWKRLHSVGANPTGLINIT